MGAVGGLCEWKSGGATMLPEQYETFDAYKATLTRECDTNNRPARLVVTPDETWADEVYYQVSD